MEFNPNNFTMPKPSRREALLRKHGYYEGKIVDGVRSLVPTEEQYTKLMQWSETDPPTKDEITTCYVYGRHEFDLYSQPNESFKDWMIRLGWLVRDDNGKLVEA